MSDTRWLIQLAISDWKLCKAPQSCYDAATMYGWRSNRRVLFCEAHKFVIYIGGFFCRRYCLQTKRLPGMHPLSAAQWCDPGPGGEGKDHTGSTTRLPRPLQQLRFSLSEQWSVRGENQRLLLQLCPVSLHRNVLPRRYKNSVCE